MRGGAFHRVVMQFTGVAAIAVVSGCVVVATGHARAEVSSPPPAPASEAPVACDPGYVRVPGHWRWNGYQYVWIPQRCVYRPGYRYEEGGYYACDDGYCYREGTWVIIAP